VLTLQNMDCTSSIIVNDKFGDLSTLLSKQWLLSNRQGSYASSSIVGCNTSSYHGLLIGSLNPPTSRVLALSNCLESLLLGDRKIDLSTFEFDGAITPAGYVHMRQFRRDTGVHFEYDLGSAQLTKSVYLARQSDTIIIEYDIKTSLQEATEFQLRPLVALRDFHSVLSTTDQFHIRPTGEGLLVQKNGGETGELLLNCTSTRFEREPQWWYNFSYRDNRERGQNAEESLWVPGVFTCQIHGPTKLIFRAQFQKRYESTPLHNLDAEAIKLDLAKHHAQIIRSNKSEDATCRRLALAADQFIVTRSCSEGEALTILAGYPWFADWGRDTFIALPGLLLSTGRYEQAQSVLSTFARAADQGMIPNRFDDRSDMTHFNSVDASLWFINAAFQYIEASGDLNTFEQQLLPAIHGIIEAYRTGTRFGIHADQDGLISAGNSETQLTWMDAKCDGVAFTPRHGKAVEINALWHNAIAHLAQYYRDRDTQQAQYYQDLAEQVSHSFQAVFWNETGNYLNDTVYPDGSIDASLRPNQIYAVALPLGPPLSHAKQVAVVQAIESNLLTPFGLRTLDPANPAFVDTYIGPQWNRDSAYHQGTVWPFLLGGFADAYLKIHEYDHPSKLDVFRFIGPLLEHFSQSACIGSVSEIFDGNPPHGPKGCFAQAWSVAELLRVYKLVTGQEDR
jgi:predicted glycogen debranching enzyme